MKQRTPGRTTLIFILLTFVGSIRPLQRPTKSKNISFNFNPSPAPIRQIQPKVVRFTVNYSYFAVVDVEDLLRITIYYQSWLKSDTFTFNISQGINDFAAIPAPNNSIMVIIPEENYRAIIVDKEGQITYDGAISNLYTPDFVNVCQITEDLFALVERGVDQTDLKLRVYDYNFNLIDSLSRNGFDINVASDGTYLYYGILPNEAASAASVFKVNPKNLSEVFASIDSLVMQETNSILLSVLGNQLMVTRVGASTGRIYWTLLDLESNLEILAARSEKNYSSSDQLIPLMNPAYTNEGYLCIAQKIDNNPWIETSMHAVTLKTIANYTLWGVTNSQMPTTLTSRYYLDVNRNGYIIPMKDFDPAENKSIVSLQFYGDVCGDGIVSGAEQCDGGELCTMSCQCPSGSRPTSPLSNDCVLDTSFTNCKACPYDTTICLEERRSCAQYRVVPILQCIQTMPFGAKRAVFSYNARIASRIEPVTTNNIITPHGTPTKDFTSGRSYIYPAASFTVDYAANTNVEWFVDGQSLSFNSSDPTLACHSYISVQVQLDQQTNMTGFMEDLTQTLVKVIGISETRLTAVEVSSKKRQTALVQVNIAGDPVSDPYAVDAAQSLLDNIAEVQTQLPAVRSISPILSTREIQGVVIGPATQSPLPDPVIEPTTNSPVVNGDVPAGWSNNYIAIIVCVPIGVGVIIFLAVFLSRKKAKKPQKIDKIPLGALSASSNYTSVPDMSPFSTARSDTALLDGISPRPVDRLHVPYEELKFKTELGAGAYGKVFIGEWQRTKVALKINTSATGDDFAREARLMVELRPHPNVVQMLGVSSDGPYPVMILEFCDGGSLDDKLFNMSEVITPQQQLEIVLGIAKGLYHLHKNQIVHRDLAARNILLNHNTPKISDFGLSRQVGEEQKGTTKSTVGPVRWMAPESLKHMTYSTKSDVWTFGVVVCEIVSRQEPHKDADPMAIGLNIRDNGAIPKIPPYCDPALKALMEKCWQADPDKRPTMEQICDTLDRYMEEMSAQQ